MNNETQKKYYKDWAIEWLSYKKDYVKESTHANYASVIYNHLIPDLGNLYLEDITHNVLQNYILEKLKTGRIINQQNLSEKTVKDIMMVLKSSLKHAMNQGKMNQINLEFIYPKNQKKTKIYILTKREQRKITEYVLENLTPRNIGILISLYSGIRIGELCALKWSDIDFKNNIIHITKTLQRIYLKNGETTTSKILVTPPKTVHSNREIPMSKDFAAIIKHLKVNPKYYVLSSTLDCIEPRTYRKYFSSVLKKLKIKPINFHSLRHTFATNCISLGIDYKTVSELLGHSDISITLNLYVHPNLSQKKKCMNLVWKNHC